MCFNLPVCWRTWDRLILNGSKYHFGTTKGGSGLWLTLLKLWLVICFCVRLGNLTFLCHRGLREAGCECSMWTLLNLNIHSVGYTSFCS
jgi:hypothetical protein